MAAHTARGIPLSAVSPRYLHTNSTSHTGPFSAIAELIDNAYDPDVSAKQFWIDKTVVKGLDCLTFMDNGNGMDYDKMHKMLSFGFSDKQPVKGHVPVGFYGNGFKSGSMRLGKDAIVFSKNADTMCVGLLSQTYLEKTEAQNVIVPIVVCSNTGQTLSVAQEYKECLHDILTHSLFNTKEELLSEFGAINGPYGTNSTGTRIIIWNLRKTSSNELEFDFTKDRYDIRIPIDTNENTGEPNNGSDHRMPVPGSEYSLRAYSSILYLKPRMQIIIRGQKVKTELVSKSLAHVIKDTYKPTFLNKGIKIIFGYNTKSKEHCGLMMYHKNRLIKPYERVACQRKANSTGVGVIGVIECNYLTPMHNKQDFENTEEYRKTIQSVSVKLEEYWKEIRHRRQKNLNCSVPVEDVVKRPDQNWVQCDECLKWRKLPDGIDTTLLPEKWFCRMNPDPQFRNCTVEEEPEDSDEEQPRYQKTYKQHERNQKLQMEKTRQQMVQEKNDTGKERMILALAKENANLLKKQKDLLRQINLGSPSQGMPSPSLNSHPPICAGSRSPDNIPIITHVASLSTVTARTKRALGPSQENGQIKRARRDSFDCNTPGSPSTSTASPELCSSQTIINLDGGSDDRARWKNNATATKEEDDDLMIIEVISSPRPTAGTKVKLERMVSEEELGKKVDHGDSDTVVSAASPPVSSRAVSIATQTLQSPAVKREEGDSEQKKKEEWSKDRESNSNHFESEYDGPPVERNTNNQLRSINEKTRAQQTSVPSLEEENQERNEAKSALKLEEELSHRDEISPGSQTSAKLQNSVLDVLEAQQQQDALLELMEVAAKERDESHAQLLLLSSQVEELRSQLLELRQNTLKKEQSHQSTQTNPEEVQDYKVLYLQGKEEIKQLQDELSELRTGIAQTERKGQEASLESDDELACQIDYLLRELDQRNKEREELKDKVDSLENEKCGLLTRYENLQKDLEERKGESEKVNASAEDQGLQTGFPISSHEERAATSAEASNSGTGRNFGTQQHETQDRPEIGQENKNIQLRELRQRVARLLVTFVPALDLQQVNYDCEVIDEILTQVIDEISPTEATST
ncbi:MORC family CW-type zinc finger protein 3-like [Neoarius graeffei]|uniref:MORC family CW-type zinc finger protein 3-like n=1 Tax=Neoarius graeffei TaxID=443677 RepID=UPI00298C90A2|nr:MORC family CW-type zinc finger protein 3-like [Neoarius graeffei]